MKQTIIELKRKKMFEIGYDAEKNKKSGQDIQLSGDSTLANSRSITRYCEAKAFYSIAQDCYEIALNGYMRAYAYAYELEDKTLKAYYQSNCTFCKKSAEEVGRAVRFCDGMLNVSLKKF